MILSPGYRPQTESLAESKSASRVSGSPIVSYDPMTAASIRRAGMLLSAIRRDGVRRLVRREEKVWFGETVAGRSERTRDLAISNKPASVASHVESIDGMADFYAQ